jgi:hypothetical protein
VLTLKSYLDEGMRKLTPAEWKKPNSQTGEARIEILKKAMAANQPITTVDNREVVIANTADNMQAIAGFESDGKAFPLTTVDNKTISSSDIGKSPMFGGGSGAGAGTEATAIAESAQCVWLAAMLKHGTQHPIEYFTPEILKKQVGDFDIGNTTLEEVFSIDADWAYSSYHSAILLIKNGFVNRSHKFHRDSKVMKSIYEAKKKAFKNSGLPVMKDDKWNPGDIWAVDPSVNLAKELDISSVGALNASLLRLYNDRKVVGISLKKVKKKAKYSELNVDASQLDQHRFQGGAVSTSRGNFFSNKGGTVQFDAGVMEIRPNNYLGSNKVEIMGKTARGGGAGWGVIAPYAKRYINTNIPEHKNLKKTAIDISKGNARAIKLFYDMAKFVEPTLTTIDAFKIELANKDAGWCSAKLAAVYLVHALMKNKGRKADDFVTAIVNYAGSKSEDASVYVKVYE